MSQPKWLKELTSYALIGGITLVCIEAILQLSKLPVLQRWEPLADLYALAHREHYDQAHCGSDFWKRLFVEAYEQDDFAIADALHQIHPTRGWTPRANLSQDLNGITYTTNNRGHRSLVDYQYDPNRYTVLVVGDSYTFGMDTQDDWVWPTLLQAQDEQLQIINLGVAGYGLDQMYVTLQESIDVYQPNLVIAAFIADNVRRMNLSFRDYKKPKLQIRAGELVATNQPIGDPEETYQEVQQALQRQDIPFLQLDDLVHNAAISCHGNYALFKRVMLAMQAIAQSRETDFLITYLASGSEIERPGHVGDGDRFLQRLDQQAEVPILNTREYFLRGDGYQGGHYQQAEAELVSQVVYDRIRDLSSWQTFQAQQD